MSDCARIRSRCHAYLDGELPAPEGAEVRAHLEGCDPCRASFERERAFLAAVAAGGRETAPPGLRRRVEAVLESGGGIAPPAGPGWRAWGLMAAAAAVALLLVARPWGGPDRPSGPTPTAVAFAADHVAHAETAPSAAPFPPGAAPAPPLGAVQGLSRCVIEGRAYAHFTYRADGATFSVFVPLDQAGLPEAIGSESAVGAGEAQVAVVAVGPRSGRPAAVLVSDALAEPALRRIWDRG